jgi:putative transposase
MRKTYPTDLSDAEWTRLRSFLPTPNAQGRPRTHSLRDVLDAIFYVLKSGCHWRLLPHDFPPWSAAYYHFRRFRLKGSWSLILKELHAAQRKRVGKDPRPTELPSWTPKVSRPQKNRPTRVATRPTRTSRGASDIFYSGMQ